MLRLGSLFGYLNKKLDIKKLGHTPSVPSFF